MATPVVVFVAVALYISVGFLEQSALPAFLAHRVAALGFARGDARETLALGRKLRAQMQAAGGAQVTS